MKTRILATVTNTPQATILQAVLSHEGIESFMKNEIISNVMPMHGFYPEIHVREADYQRARNILQERFPQLVSD